MANKKTIVEMFNEIIATYELTDEHRTFVEGRIAQAMKKSGNKSAKPSAKQTENLALAEKVLAEMVEFDKPMTISELMKSVNAFAEIEDLSNQKATSIIRSLLKADKVERSVEKGKAYFKAIAD